jgi:ABC-type multidrug transport system ATPase subunit
MFGLLGPNGAGKSTLMRIIATLQEADTGKVSFDNINVLKQKHEVKKVLGYLPQEFGFYPKDTCYDLLNHFTMLKGITNKSERKSKVEELLKRVNLWQSRNIKLGEFSGGMKQRFGIAQALLGKPKLIIVDEPTAGLDPAERNRFHNLLSEIGEDIIIILSTHIVDDVSDLCENMAIINEGKIIVKANTQESMN